MEQNPSAVSTPQGSTVQIPEIAGSLKTLFILRTALAFGLILGGVACLYFGGNMLLASLKSTEIQSILFEIPNKIRVTAGGFGAVVMAASLVPFFLAYRTRPTIELIPTGSSGYEIRIGASALPRPQSATSARAAHAANTGEIRNAGIISPLHCTTAA